MRIQATARTATLLEHQCPCKLLVKTRLSFKGEALFMIAVPPGEVARGTNLKVTMGGKAILPVSQGLSFTCSPRGGSEEDWKEP